MRKIYDISSYTPLKPGTRIMCSVFCNGEWMYTEAATVCRWTARMGLREWLPAGYEPVRFDDTGGRLMVHCGSFRVVDNRPERAKKIKVAA